MANLYGFIEPSTKKDVEVTVCGKLHLIFSEGKESKIAVMIPHDIVKEKFIEYMGYMSTEFRKEVIEELKNLEE